MLSLNLTCWHCGVLSKTPRLHYLCYPHLHHLFIVTRCKSWTLKKKWGQNWVRFWRACNKGAMSCDYLKQRENNDVCNDEELILMFIFQFSSVVFWVKDAQIKTIIYSFPVGWSFLIVIKLDCVFVPTIFCSALLIFLFQWRWNCLFICFDPS